MKRKILSLFVAAMMILTILSASVTSVFAADPDEMIITGRVTDEKGDPIALQLVDLDLYDEQGEFRVKVSEETDFEGRYSFEFSTTFNKSYCLKTFNPGVEGLYSERRNTCSPGEFIEDLSIIRYGTTVIHVSDEDGNPVPPGVPVWITYTGPPPNPYDTSWPWESPSDGVTPHHLTDDDGNIILYLLAAWGHDGIPGVDAYSLGGFDYAYPAGTKPGGGGIDQSSIINYHTDDDLTSELRYELWTDDGQPSYAVDVSSQAGKTRHVDYKVRGLGKIEVQAKDSETGESIPDVYVDFDTESDFYKYWKRNDDYSGLSFYTYHDDTATITAKKPSDPLENYLGYQNAEATVTAVRWENTQVDLLMQKNSYGTVSGRILDSSGNGVAGATVELLWPDEYSGGYFMMGYGSDYYTALKTVQTDEEGRYTFNDVIPTPEYETYAVRATKENMTTGVSYEFSLASGEDVSVSDLTMDLAPDVPFWESGAGISAVSVGWGGVILEWPAAYVEDDYNYYVDGYRVYQEGNLAADISADDYEDAPAIRCRIGGLEPDTTYSFSVQAYSNTGNSSEILVMEEPVTTLPEYDPDAKVIRASMSSEGLEGNFVGKPQDENDMPESCWPTMSADGRFIAFESCADSLYDRDYNQTGDIFVFDRQTGILECISLSYDGETGNSYSFRADISADGRYVVFASNASNLVPGDYVNSENVYLYDRESKSMELVSDDDMDYISSAPRLSGDGRYVVYGGSASDDKSYIFIWDRDSKTTVRLDHPVVDEGDVEGPFNSVISNDGNYIAFDFCVVFYEGDAQVWDSYVYVYNQQTGTTELVSRRDDNPDEPASGFFPSISADGRYIAFESEDALVAGDVNNHYDIFVYDRIEGQMKLVSLGYDGSQGNGDSGCSAISANGRFVVFSSEASSLVPDDNNSDSDVFVRDLVRDTTERVSVSADGSEGDVPPDYSWFSIAAISDCGRYVAYESAFSLVPNDNNETLDIYIYDRGPQEDSITVPTAPQNLTATPGDGRVTLSWTAPADDGGAEITRYEVSGDDGANWTDVGLNTSYTFIDLTNGTEYTFKVRAVNSAGYGEAAITTATPIGYVCKIGGTNYATLNDALAALIDNTPVTITLLKNITYTGGIELSQKKLTIDLNGKTLTVNNTAGIGIKMILGSELNLTGTGSFNVNAQMAGLHLTQSTFTSPKNVAVEISSNNNYGIYTDSCMVSLHGNVSGASGGVFASTDNTITVNGTVTSTGTGSENHAVRLNGTGNTVQVGEAVVTAGGGSGIYVNTGARGTVTVGSQENPGRVAGKGSGLWIRSGAAVTVYGNVEGSVHGIDSYENSTITVYGNVKSTADSGERYGIKCFANSNAAHITVNGNVEGASGVYVHGAQSELAVNGNVTAKGMDPSVNLGAYAGYAKVSISGNLTANNCLGAHSFENSEIIIDGTITAQKYVKVLYTEKDISENDATSTREGYLQYSHGSAFVWVKAAPSAPTVSTAPQNFTATPGDGQVVLNWAAPADDGGAEITRYEVSSDNGDTWVTVITGTSYTFTGLTNGIEYTFKVRAVNSAGAGAEASTTATPTAPPVTKYTVTVTNGTGSGEYEEGDTVMITADSPPEGQQFKEWQVISGDVTLENTKAPSTSFTMPANDVEITAVYEKIPVTTYTVTVNGSYAATTGAGSYAQGDTVTINAGSRANYSFSGWTSPDDVTFANPNSATTTFIMPAKNVTVKANWTYIGSDNKDDDDTGVSTPSAPETPTYNANVKTEQGTEMTVPVTIDKDEGTASVDVDSDKLAQGAVNITIPSIPDVDAYSVGIPVQELSTVDAQDAFVFNTEAGSATVPSNMLTGVAVPEGDKAQITIGRGDKSYLPEDVRDVIGDRPLVQLTLTIDGNLTEWNNPDAPVTVTIPYTPTAEELDNPESIVVWYIDGSGNVVCITNGRYDSATGTVTFTTTHFSYYAVSCKQVNFKDVAKDAWYAKAVSFIAARDITQGTGSGRFSPEAKLTRAQFVVMMMRAYDIAPDENPEDNFADAGNTWYTGYLAAAKRLGISAGVGNNMFAPDRDITRQEMFTLLYNALRVIGQLPGTQGRAVSEAGDQPEGDCGKTFSNFSDVGDIAPWAKEAMKLLVETGTISGIGNRLSPKDTTTRAQMAQVLYKLLSK